MVRKRPPVTKINGVV